MSILTVTDLEECVGKWLVRTKESKRGDRSFCSAGIKIVAITSGVIYYQRSDGGQAHSLLRSEWDDGHWELSLHNRLHGKTVTETQKAINPGIGISK